MFRRIVVLVVCLGLLGAGAMLLSASPAGRNIFVQASDEGSCATKCPAKQPAHQKSAGFMIAGNDAHGSYVSETSGVCQSACGVKQEYDASQVVAQPGAGPGDLTQCPVSGVVFAVASDRPAVTVGDDSYRLCCDGCAEKFRADPAQFLRL